MATRKKLSETDGTHGESDRFFEILKGESDRGLAIVSAAYIDDLLAALLRTSLRKDPTLYERIMGARGPLESFSAKIDIAYGFGLLTRDGSKMLHSVREIRNDFAHNWDATFDDQSIADRCINLGEKSGLMVPDSVGRGAAARERFFFATLFLLSRLSAVVRNSARGERTDGAKGAAVV